MISTNMQIKFYLFDSPVTSENIFIKTFAGIIAGIIKNKSCIILHFIWEFHYDSNPAAAPVSTVTALAAVLILTVSRTNSAIFLTGKFLALTLDGLVLTV